MSPERLPTESGSAELRNKRSKADARLQIPHLSAFQWIVTAADEQESPVMGSTSPG